MVDRKLATLSSLKGLGKYYEFDFVKEIEGDFTKTYCIAKQQKKNLYWLVKSVGGLHRTDIDADMFYVKAKEGFVGILYKSRIGNGTYRIVFFVRTLKRLPRTARRYSMNKSPRKRY